MCASMIHICLGRFVLCSRPSSSLYSESSSTTNERGHQCFFDLLQQSYIDVCLFLKSSRPKTSASSQRRGHILQWSIVLHTWYRLHGGRVVKPSCKMPSSCRQWTSKEESFHPVIRAVPFHSDSPPPLSNCQSLAFMFRI